MGTCMNTGDPGGIRTPDPRLRRAWRRFLEVKTVDGLNVREPSISADFKRFTNVFVYSKSWYFSFGIRSFFYKSARNLHANICAALV